MAITNIGFDGTVNEIGDAKRSAHIGSYVPVVEGPTDFKVTVAASPALTVNVAPGTAWAHGILTTSDANATVTLPSVGSQTRWDAIVLRRDWSANTATITSVQHSSLATKTVPAINANIGVLYDQLLALVQVTAGQTAPTAIVDLRAWASKVVTVADLLGLPSPRIGQEALVGKLRYRRELDGNGSPQWVRYAGSVSSYTGTGFVTLASGWALNSGTVAYRHGTAASIYLNLRRSGSRIVPGSDGQLSDLKVLTVHNDAAKPDYTVPFSFRYVGGSSSSSAGSFGGFAELRSDGGLWITALQPSMAINTRSGSDTSVLAHLSFVKGSVA